MTDRKFKEILWHTSLFWKPFLFVSKDAYGIEYLPSYLAVLYKHAILNCLQSRKYCEAIMDDLLLFTPTKSSHFEKLKDLLKALHKNGLKISPKKCQLFKTDLQYMGNTIFIRNKRVCVRPLRSQIEAIQKLKAAYYSQRLSKLCGYGKFCQYILPQTSKTFEAHI